jgi:hypothetical protein
MPDNSTKYDLAAEADEALEAARSMPSGPEKVEALKKAGLLRNAASSVPLFCVTHLTLANWIFVRHHCG